MSPSQKKNTKGHNLFDPKESTTYKRLPGKTWKIQVSSHNLNLSRFRYFALF